MNALRANEYGRVITGTAIIVGALMLAGCGGSSLNRRFARCDPKEVTGHRPVDISDHELKQPYNIVFLRDLIKRHPQVLIDTARRIHPDPSHPNRDLLRHTYDMAHDSNTGNDYNPSGHDNVNGPGDILCEIRPFGDPNAPTREVYYDQDGLDLLKRVDEALDHLSENPIN